MNLSRIGVPLLLLSESENLKSKVAFEKTEKAVCLILKIGSEKTEKITLHYLKWVFYTKKNRKN